MTDGPTPEADYVHFSESRSFDYVPDPSRLPSRLLPLAGALQIAPDEIGRNLDEFRFVDYEVALEPRLIGTEHAVTWTVGEREPLKYAPKTQVWISGETSKTLVRAELYD